MPLKCKTPVSTAVLGAVADAVKQMAESMATKLKGSGLDGLERICQGEVESKIIFSFQTSRLI